MVQPPISIARCLVQALKLAAMAGKPLAVDPRLLIHRLVSIPDRIDRMDFVDEIDGNAFTSPAVSLDGSMAEQEVDDIMKLECPALSLGS